MVFHSQQSQPSLGIQHITPSPRSTWNSTQTLPPSNSTSVAAPSDSSNLWYRPPYTTIYQSPRFLCLLTMALHPTSESNPRAPKSTNFALLLTPRPHSSTSTTVPTRLWDKLFWPPLTKCKYALSNTSTSDTASHPPEPSWNIYTQPTPTSTPRIYKKTTLSFGHHMTSINQLRLSSTG